MKKRVYSGIRATGRLHLGNYMGAVKGMLALQETHDCVFSVVDLHAITTPYEPSLLQNSIREVVLDFLGAGLDPNKCKLEIQSQVPQHTELAYLLSTIYPVSRLEDLPTYKDKKAQYPKYVNMGLLYYPVLMAADVLLYKGELVPVGIDQEPHLEVMREIARKFNSMFPSAGSGQVTFPEPQRFKTEGEYVPSVTGSGKMSKTVEGSYINLSDSLETIRAKVAKIPTDTGVPPENTYSSEEEYIKAVVEGPLFGLYQYIKLFLGEERMKEVIQEYIAHGIKNYKKRKEEITEAIYKELQPIQQKRKEFEANPKTVDEILENSNKKCLTIASETIREVKEKMGLL